jgi:biotin carboxyl carrier protein
MEEIKVKVGGKEYKVKVEETPEGKLRVHHGDEVYEMEREKGEEFSHESLKRKIGEGDNVAVAPLPGIVQEICVKKGQEVKKGGVLLTLVAMKMENDVISPREGKIKSIPAKKGQTVNRGDVLVELE